MSSSLNVLVLLNSRLVDEGRNSVCGDNPGLARIASSLKEISVMMTGGKNED